jgi:hypothetical protein
MRGDDPQVCAVRCCSSRSAACPSGPGSRKPSGCGGMAQQLPRSPTGIAPGARRRFDVEHPFRFLKQTLNWTLPRVRSPEQADRWTWLVVLAYTQLRLAWPLVADQRLPWQRPQPAGKCTPARVQRGFSRLVSRLPVLASPPKPCGRSPGRPKGKRSGRAARYPALTKAILSKAILSASHAASINLLAHPPCLSGHSAGSSLDSSWLNHKLSGSPLTF